MYQALYRKWRPKTFDAVIGQKHITESLRNQVLSGRLSHAYIFIGSRGTGKTSCARILAKAVNCEHPVNGNPCCECNSCITIDEGTAMDIVELDAASNNGVDNVRALRDEAVFSPANAKRRVYIIDEVHMLSTAAFNALLKILEEPPAHLMFILCTTELQKVPATILSRCQRHSFKRIETAELSEYIAKVAKLENLDITAEAADLIAGLAEGGVRDALSILDQCSEKKTIELGDVYSAVGLAGNLSIIHIYENILIHNFEEVVNSFDLLWRNGSDPAGILRQLSTLVRNIILMKVAPKAAGNLIYGGYDLPSLSKFAAEQTVEELTNILNTLQNTLSTMRDGINPKVNAELCMISLCTRPDGDSISSLRARISAIEEKISGSYSENTQRAVSREKKAGVYESETDNRDVSSPMSEGEAADRNLDASDISNPAENNIKSDGLETVAAEEAVSETYNKPVQTDNKTDLWDKICETAKPMLQFSERMFISDANNIIGVVKDSFLEISVSNEFMFKMFNKSENIEIIGKAAEAVAGGKINVSVKMAKKDGTSARDINELRQFSEVKFT